MADTGSEGGAEVSRAVRDDRSQRPRGFGSQREGFVLRAESCSYRTSGSVLENGMNVQAQERHKNKERVIQGRWGHSARKHSQPSCGTEADYGMPEAAGWFQVCSPPNS